MPPVSQPPEGGEAPAEGAAPATPDTTPAAPAQPEGFDRIYERMDEFQNQQQQLVDQISEALTPPEEEPDYYDDGGELTEDGAQRLIDERVNQGVDQRFTEFQRERAIEDRDFDFDELVGRVPELQDPKYSREIIAQAADLVGHNDAVIEHPRFVRIIEAVHARRKYEEHAAAQTPAGGQGVVLESAQGAAQPQASDEPDWGDRIVQAAERLRPQI